MEDSEILPGYKNINDFSKVWVIWFYGVSLLGQLSLSLTHFNLTAMFPTDFTLFSSAEFGLDLAGCFKNVYI